MGVFATAARVLHVLLTGIWLGAGVLTILLVHLVPETLQSQQSAELVVSAARTHLDNYGMIAGPVALLTLAIGWVPLMVPLRVRVLLTFAATGAAGFSGQYLVPKMQQVMDAMGRPLEDLPRADPLVGQYLDLSMVSLGALGIQVVAALLLTMTAVAASKPKRSGGLEF